MRLSEHFTLDELTVSETAARKGLDNTPPPDVVAVLKYTASHLEGVRALLGHPITVLSGYRSPEVNRAVGGAKASAHMGGWAVDFICPGYGTPQQIASRLKDSAIQYDQIIEEFGQWVHISFAPQMRNESLVARRINGRTVYEKS